MYTRPVIDTHVHLYDVAQWRYPWLDNIPPLKRPVLLADYTAAIGQASVEQFVFVEVAAHADDALNEVRWIDRHCATDPKPIGMHPRSPTLGAIVAQARLERGAAVEEELTALLETRRVTGVRRIVAAPFQTDPAFCLRSSFIEGVNRVGRLNLSFDIGASSSYLPAVVTFARQCENVRLVLDHLGLPLIKERVMEPWRSHLRELAAMPHVHCKISGLLAEAGENWSAAAIAPYILEAADAFGFDRILFGSDFPVQNLVGSFTAWFDVVSDIMESASLSETRRFFYDNARIIYRIPTLAGTPTSQSTSADRSPQQPLIGRPR